MKAIDSLNKALNSLYSSEGTQGYVAERFIIAQQAIREAIQFLLIADLESYFELYEADKSDLLIKFDVATGQYRVGSFWMFKAFIESGSSSIRNLAYVAGTRVKAEQFIADFKADQNAFDDVLELMESLHP